MDFKKIEEDKIASATFAVLETLDNIGEITIKEAANILTAGLVSVLKSVGVMEEDGSAIKIGISGGNIYVVNLDADGNEILQEEEENEVENSPTRE